MSIKINKAIDIVIKEKGFLVTYKDFASILDKDEEAIRRRMYRKGNLKNSEALKICEEYALDPALFFEIDEARETIVVEYYDNHKLKLRKNPKYKNYYMDRELANDYNPNYKDSDFKILCALDDTMDGGELWIRTNDVVLLDVSYNDVTRPGMYVYECLGGKYMRAAFIEIMMDGSYKFRYKNPKYKEQERTPKELEEVDFRVVGRIIKNLMFFA